MQRRGSLVITLSGKRALCCGIATALAWSRVLAVEPATSAVWHVVSVVHAFPLTLRVLVTLPAVRLGDALLIAVVVVV